MMSISLAAVKKRFGATQALAGVTLEAGTGVTGLLGPNGAGKTTLLRIVATVLVPDDGGLRILGRDPANARQRIEIRRRLGYMPQEPGFYKSFTAFEFIDYVAILKEMTDKRERHSEVARVLDIVELADVAERKIRALSGGMRRRVALAQALLGNPSVLILDEPTAGLDPEQRLRFRELVSELAENRAVLLSTHQTEDVAALCNRVIVMRRGATVFEGAPREVAEIARGKVWVGDERASGARLSWRTGEGRRRSIGDPPPGAELTEPTIEDGYMLLVGEDALEGAA